MLPIVYVFHLFWTSVLDCQCQVLCKSKILFLCKSSINPIKVKSKVMSTSNTKLLKNLEQKSELIFFFNSVFSHFMQFFKVCFFREIRSVVKIRNILDYLDKYNEGTLSKFKSSDQVRNVNLMKFFRVLSQFKFIYSEVYYIYLHEKNCLNHRHVNPVSTLNLLQNFQHVCLTIFPEQYSIYNKTQGIKDKKTHQI